MNLSLSQNEHEELRHSASQLTNNQQRVQSVKHRRLNEHSGDSLARSTKSSCAHGSAGVPGVQDEPGDDH